MTELQVKLPWFAPGVFEPEELRRPRSDVLDLDGAFRGHLAAPERAAEDLAAALARFRILDASARLAGPRLQELYDLARLIAALRLARGGLVDDDLAHRLGSGPGWYYTAREAVPRFGSSAAALARPGGWGDLPQRFAAFLANGPFPPRPPALLRARIVHPGQLPYAVVLARHLRRRAPASTLEVEGAAWPGGEAALARAFRPALVRAGSRAAWGAPRALDDLGRAPREVLDALARAGRGGAVRVGWRPRLDRGARERAGAVPAWLRRSGRRVVLEAHVVLRGGSNETALFGVLDTLVEARRHARAVDLRVHLAAPRGGGAETIRREAHLADMLGVQLDAEGDALRAPRVRIETAALLTRPSFDLASRYPLDELASCEPQPDARRHRFGRDARLPAEATAAAARRPRRYRFFRDAGPVLRRGGGDRLVDELLAAFERPRQPAGVLRARGARGSAAAELIDALETLVYAGVLERAR
jgi:hypothetical protein